MSMKPTPKKEAAFKIMSRNIIYLWFASSDAAESVRREAAEFGSYHIAINCDYDMLFVSPLYDTGDVLAYLNELVGNPAINETE